MPAKDLEELEALEAEEYADEMAAEAEELALAQMRAEEEAMGGGMAAVSEEGEGDTFGGEAGLEDDEFSVLPLPSGVKQKESQEEEDENALPGYSEVVDGASLPMQTTAS